MKILLDSQSNNVTKLEIINVSNKNGIITQTLKQTVNGYNKLISFGVKRVVTHG